MGQEQEAEGKVTPIAGQDACRTGADFLGVPGLGGFRGKFAEGAEPALGEHAFGCFKGHEQDAANGVAVGNGAVGVREESFFDEPVAVEPQCLVHGPGGFPCRKHSL
jgi:hypothetical protein